VTFRTAATWVVLVALGSAAALGLARLGVPAPWLIGPLIAGLAVSLSGAARLRVPRLAFTAAQAAIGILIAQTFTPPILGTIARDWWAIAVAVAATIGAAALAGWLLARFSPIPAVTAAWGSSPGGAAVMTLLSAEHGADTRIVALMQYLRVTLVVLSASVVSKLLLPAGVHPTPPTGAGADWWALPATAAVAVIGAWGATRLGVPSGAFLGPMLLGAVLHGMGLVRLAVPGVVIEAAYVAVGLGIGLLYTRETVLYAMRVFAPLLLSTCVLIALCAGSAALFAINAHVDALTAYLATTPGGLDSVTVLALGSRANIPLVIATQTLRLFVVILTGPPLARLISRFAGSPERNG
jgi:hypothetical protein